MLTWGVEGFTAPTASHVTGFMFEVITYTGAFFTLRRVLSYPGCFSAGYILPTILTWYGGLMLVFFGLQLDYSVYYILSAAAANSLFFFLSYFLVISRYQTKIAFLPLGKATRLDGVKGVEWLTLTTPNLTGERIDAVAADLHADIPAEWQRFLAQCTLNGVPVYHYKQLLESLTGRVRINHLSENEFGSLLPSAFYSNFKRLFDLTLAFILLPILLPVLLLVSVWIKKDSDGPAFFVQERMGFRGKLFKVYKFRSMRTDLKGRGFTEGEDDPRITKVGKIIRKYRIDELPQLFNVIKGDMSFIGPRPESKSLSDWYERDVPFFSYRHIVRPGISGWAQVEQGYAAEVDGMKKKLEYDFYYIKNYSLWLDILIIFKTIKTVLTGSGAR
ncbi:exopolysaccharide biosynthesis polyprenyl glycosylphosphotransferase [Oceanisphaera ostreae]|uniref:Exopolysaccharide biosynthesis polyprenyl glycosylphosphotransferase n=1 Tax=Oceanisphaera ostreae TaxID=914151 RepID=A0ABW3KH16_9GAMM